MTVRHEFAEFCAVMMDATVEELDLFYQVARTRRRFLDDMQAHENQGLVATGDDVKITERLSTQYLHGCKAEVLEPRREGLYIRVYNADEARYPDKARSKGIGWQGVVPYSCVERV